MNKIRENPATSLLVVGIVLLCAVAVFLLFRVIRNVTNINPPTPLSNIVLKIDDLNPELFVPTGQASNCDRYLFIPASQNNMSQTPLECYQVKFSAHDNSIVILNAIWLFNRPGEAELEINKFSELIPPDIGMRIVDVPNSLGEKSAASSAILTGGSSPIYVTNLYWRKGPAVVRLTVINYQGPIPLESLMTPAYRINARLESR